MSVSGGFSLLEIDWFTEASFSLAMNFSKQWSTRSTIQLFSNAAQVASIAILYVDLTDSCQVALHASQDASTADEQGPLLEKLKTRQAISLFALAMLHTTEARAAPSADSQVRDGPGHFSSSLLLSGFR
jgi:hypothetical protein